MIRGLGKGSGFAHMKRLGQKDEQGSTKKTPAPEAIAGLLLGCRICVGQLLSGGLTKTIVFLNCRMEREKIIPYPRLYLKAP